MAGRLIVMCITLLLSFGLSGQEEFIIDDMTDMDLNDDPVWFGDVGEFQILQTPFIPGGTAITDRTFLALSGSTQPRAMTFASDENEIWMFSIATASVIPSPQNAFGIILMSDRPLSGDITSTSNIWFGYYLKIGAYGSNDKFELWRSSGAVKSAVGSFTSSPVIDMITLQAGFDVMVVRGENGAFRVYYGNGFVLDSQIPDSTDILVDNTITTSSYFGVFANFSGAPTKRFYCDNIILGNFCDFGDPQIETSPDSITFSLDDDDSFTQCITIYNSGCEFLEWTAGEQSGGGSSSAPEFGDIRPGDIIIEIDPRPFNEPPVEPPGDDDCPWLILLQDSGYIHPGGSEHLMITLDTLALDSLGLASGTYHCAVIIESNDPLNPQVTLGMTLQVQPDTVLAPGSMNYSLKVTNRNNAPLALDAWVQGYDPNDVPVWEHPRRFDFNLKGNATGGSSLALQIPENGVEGTYRWVAAVGQYPDLIRAVDSISIVYSQRNAPGLAGADSLLPGKIILKPNYPNPFNPATTIKYRMVTAGEVSIIIYDLLGRQVKQLAVASRQAAGEHSIQWGGRDDTGRPVASGVYVYQLRSKNGIQSKKMMLLR